MTTSNTNSNWNSDSWADGEFEPLDEDTFTGNLHRNNFASFHLNKHSYVGNPKLDEARRKREEKKVQRQRELESRRAARGPLKLGAKKL